MVTLNTTDLNRLLTEGSSKAPSSLVPDKPRTVGSAAAAALDTLEIKGSKPSADLNEKAIIKLSEKLSESDQTHSFDILKIMRENSPSAMKSLRAIMANKAGIEAKAEPNLEMLSKALQAAASTSEPECRVADIMTTLGLVPEGQKDKFLKAAESLLTLENSAPRPGTSVAVNPTTGNYQASGLVRAEVNFDLFFSISARSSVKSGENASGSFYEATHEVASTFEANFSFEISGRFLSLADAAEKIDPKVLDAFSEAVAGLASMDSNALDHFLAASKKLFDEVEENYGVEGMFDGVAEELTATAESFVLAAQKAASKFELPETMGPDNSLLAALQQLASPEDEALTKALTKAENARSLRFGDMNQALKLFKSEVMAS